MKLTSIALGLVLAAGATAPAAAQYSQPAPPPQQTADTSNGEQQAEVQTKIKPSKAALKAIIELQTAVNANDVANIPAKLAAAQAAAKTPDDRYLIAGNQYKAAVAAKDQAARAAALEALIASGVASPSDLKSFYADLSNTYTALKQPDRASAALQRLIALDPNNEEAVVVLANTLKMQGHTPEAVALLQKQIAKDKAAGGKADEQLYKLAVQYSYDAKLPSSMDIAREWVAAYPSPANWENTFAVLQNLSNLDESGLLDLLRLKRAAGALSSAADYHKYAYLAAGKGFPGEAQTVLNEGIAAGKIDRNASPFKETLASLGPKAAADKAALANASVSGPKAATAHAALASGDLLAGAGQYAEAAAVDRAALGKPGADANTINLHLGAALAQQGEIAGATAALNAVAGPEAPIAKLWLTYLATRK